jgi:hypothetical protein
VSIEGIAGEELVELDADHDQLRASLARFVGNAEGMVVALGADLDWAVTPDSLKISADLQQRAHRSTRRTEG